MESNKVDDNQKLRISSHWDSLKRFDSYITAVNFKCGLIITLNAAVFGGVILKLKELASEPTPLLYPIYIIAGFVFLLSLLSIYMVIRTITPRLKSESTSSGVPSLFFFGSISKNFTSDQYSEASSSSSADQIEKDLAVQVHEVATITSLKMKTISYASGLTSLNLIALFVLALTLIADKLGMSICLI